MRIEFDTCIKPSFVFPNRITCDPSPISASGLAAHSPFPFQFAALPFCPISKSPLGRRLPSESGLTTATVIGSRALGRRYRPAGYWP